METKQIKQIIRIFEQSEVHKMDLEVDNIKISLEKESKTQPVITQTMPVIQKEEVTVPVQMEVKEENFDDYIKAPFVGTYYAASSETSDPYVKVGDTVKKGETLFIIEAMKVMNEIKATEDGIVKDIKGINGQMVEFDEPLMLIG